MTIKAFPSIEPFHAVVIPLTGFGDLLTSNIFVLGSGPVTLIDTGPKFPGSVEVLRSGLKQAGFDFADVERIIMTHGHIDHFGMASQIIRAASRPVSCYMHQDDMWRASEAYISSNLWSDEVKDFVLMAGMPELAVERMRRRSAFFKHFCEPVEGIIPMGEGDIFTGDGYSLQVLHTPGHSPGSCCLYEREKRILFTGDHVIKHITPNPIMEVRKSLLSDPSYQSLTSYEASLERVTSLDVRYAFPGHGEYIDDLKGLISRYRHHHEKRKNQISEALAGRSRPIYDLVEDLFPDIPESEIFLAVSEIFSHLEVLMNAGRARKVKQGPPALFEAT